nr:MAG TPA: hypothetical protein [Caudoviricetes sp.]
MKIWKERILSFHYIILFNPAHINKNYNRRIF